MITDFFWQSILWFWVDFFLLPNRSTNLALSFLCVNRTRPDFSSAQVKESSLVSSRPDCSCPSISSPSCALNKTSRPLLGSWISWKISRSEGLSRSLTWSRVGGSGAKPPTGTSREPLTWRTGGWVFTERRKEDKNKDDLVQWSIIDKVQEKIADTKSHKQE